MKTKEKICLCCKTNIVPNDDRKKFCVNCKKYIKTKLHARLSALASKYNRMYKKKIKNEV